MREGTMKTLMGLLCAWLLLPSPGFGQETFPVNGVKDKRPAIYAFTNATLFVDFQTKIENATLLIKDGKVENAGVNISIPKNAIVSDLKGKIIYPSFIDPYSNYGVPSIKSEPIRFGDRSQLESKTKGPFNWNEAVKAEYDAFTDFTIKAKEADSLRKAGFGAVNSFRNDGLIRGTSVFINLANDRDQNVVLKDRAAAHFAFDKGSSRQSYPSSLMGYIALVRQTYLDAQWYAASGNKKFNDQSLESFNRNKSLPAIFEVKDKLSVLRADKLGDEFGIQYIIKGSGDEYQRIGEIKGTQASLILPVNFPDAYDVEDPYDARMVGIAEMKHWELAPANPMIVAQNKINFAFTAYGLKGHSKYLTNIRKAVKYGLDESTALKAMTYAPAQMLGVENLIGSLKKGMEANFIITSGNLFDEKTFIHQNWVHGKPYEMVDLEDLTGNYSLSVGSNLYQLEISGKPGALISKVKATDSVELKSSLKINDKLVTLSFDSDTTKSVKGKIRLSGYTVEKILKGKGQLPDGIWVEWLATHKEPLKELKKDDKKDEKKPEWGQVIYPFAAYGSPSIPQPQTILIRNTTLWTNEVEGILTQTDVLLNDGKIQQVGKNISSPGALVIDGTNKHVTSGIIDEHTHIAVVSINDVQSVSAEVRMGDVIDSDDINIYRQLAGGVVSGQLLHGSANTIGGQSALVKYRWGKSPEEIKIKDADAFIKCALGENVKQSNWGNDNTVRYPQTRMGVEQVFVDAFTRAQEYEKEWKAYQALPVKVKTTTAAPRKDLELDALVEILNRKRFITCHSYVQSEINMLMKVAERFNFRINTFTHVLEGYKVADKMAAHGAAGSTFADWWAYKMEVKEAIPYNAALMNNAGVVTAINSDDAEMARRLNQEAAKTVKYGGLTEEQAWKTVTLNPAKMLHLDKHMGSIKAGKDADVVIWSDNPLSVYAKVEKTIIDGVIYYDHDKDMQMRQAQETEKIKIIQKMIQAKKAGEPVQKPGKKEKHLWHCEDILDDSENAN